MKTAQRSLPMFPVLTRPQEAGSSSTRIPSSNIPFTLCQRDHPVRQVSPPRSPSIPIAGEMSSSPPEVDRRYEEAIADQRDYIMFTRILGRLSQQNQEKKRFMICQDNSPIMMNIINTRNGYNDVSDPVESCDSQSFRRCPGMTSLGDAIEIEDEPMSDYDDDVVFQLDL